MIGSRALQIGMGAPFLIKLSEKDLEDINYNPVEIAKKEFEAILRKQQQLENTNHQLQQKAGDIKRSLDDLDITESQYNELSRKSDDDLSLKDFVSVSHRRL